VKSKVDAYAMRLFGAVVFLLLSFFLGGMPERDLPLFRLSLTKRLPSLCCRHAVLLPSVAPLLQQDCCMMWSCMCPKEASNVTPQEHILSSLRRRVACGTFSSPFVARCVMPCLHAFSHHVSHHPSPSFTHIARRHFQPSKIKQHTRSQPLPEPPPIMHRLLKRRGPSSAAAPADKTTPKDILDSGM
jgi:hypothetical protein